MSKLEEIREVVKNIKIINRDDVNQVVKLQDLFNVTTEEARIIWDGLERYERRTFLWIMCSVCGQDSFEFFLEYGFTPAIIERLEANVLKEHEQEYQEIHNRRVELSEKEYALDLRESELKNKERLLLAEKENLAIKVQREQGKKLANLRQLLNAANKELRQEREFTRKTKAFLTRLKAV